MSSNDEILPAPIIGLVGWLIPGAGYILLGDRKRGITVGVTIIAIFFMGILIAGVRCVQAPDIMGGGPFASRIINKPWFIGQVLNGPLGIGAAIAADQLAQSPRFKTVEAKARLAEIGTLYTAVAGMLNLLAIIDSSARAANAERKRG